MTLPSISAQQRALLYEYVAARLSGLGDVLIVIEEENFEKADELGLEFSDFLRFLHDDLRWGDQHEGKIELTAPPDVLRRVVARVKEQVELADREEAEERAELREQQRRNQLIRETCDQLLAEIQGD